MDSGKVLCKLLASIAELVSYVFLGKGPSNVLSIGLFWPYFKAFMFVNQKNEIKLR